MSFKASIVNAAKLKADEYDQWEFKRNSYKYKPADFCEFLIEPLWTFRSLPSVSLQPVVGVLVPEVEKIWTQVSGLKKGPCSFFSGVKRADNLKLRYRPSFYQKDYGSEELAVAAVMEAFDYILSYGTNYINSQYDTSSKETFLESIEQVTRGNMAEKYCIVRGLLGDLDYVNKFYKDEIDPGAPKSFKTTKNILDYFS
ncbi:hypothetical protein [Microbulbifer sp. TYP-18]|uniref:hypothetical protein n=1 Tax=Microbulbifer sp. TYP-18 TaxID=3230024 RepID=UPI0034C64FB0